MLTRRHKDAKKKWMVIHMTLKIAVEGKEYIIQGIETDDEELNAFLFSLGCYIGEQITVVSHMKNSCVVSIKDGRYNIDHQLADAILI
jgi:Fe2+ transport system protein FeoA